MNKSETEDYITSSVSGLSSGNLLVSEDNKSGTGRTTSGLTRSMVKSGNVSNLSRQTSALSGMGDKKKSNLYRDEDYMRGSVHLRNSRDSLLSSTINSDD